VPPVLASLVDWWDNRDSDFSTTGSLIDTWTGRVNGETLTGTGTTRPTLNDVQGTNYVYFDNDYLEIGNGYTEDKQDATILVVAKMRDTDVSCFWGANTAALGSIDYTQFGYVRSYQAGGGGTRNSTVYHGNGITTFYRRSNSTDIRLGCAGESTSGLTVASAGTYTNARIGDYAGTTSVNMDEMGRLVYSKALSDSELNEALDFLAEQYHTESRTNDAVLFMQGDSLTAGTGSTDLPLYNWPMQMSRSLANNPRFEEAGTVGGTAQSFATASDAITWFTNQAALSKETCVYWMGINDILGGRTSAQINADIDSFISNLRGTHTNIPIVVCTLIANNGLTGGQETIRGEVNTHISGLADSITFVADLDATALGTWSSTNFADATHCNDTGYGIVASTILSTLQTNSRL
jgi:lysophospholipase L1-like esterase